MNPEGWFIVRAIPADQTKPLYEERYSRFGEALERALELGSALDYRSVTLSDMTGSAYATFNLLWTIPRELR